MCSLCRPVAGALVCAQCSARATLEWEERGDTTWSMAFLRTFLDSVREPGALGQRLSEAGHGTAAFAYAVLCALLGSLPLSFVVTALLALVADAHRLGLRSTSVLTIAVLSLLSPLVASVLFGLWTALWALSAWSGVRLVGGAMRYDRVLRLSAYGMSLLAVPLLGPWLLPLALAMMAYTLLRAFARELGTARATLALVLAALPFGLFALGIRLLRTSA